MHKVELRRGMETWIAKIPRQVFEPWTSSVSCRNVPISLLQREMFNHVLYRELWLAEMDQSGVVLREWVPVDDRGYDLVHFGAKNNCLRERCSFGASARSDLVCRGHSTYRLDALHGLSPLSLDVRRLMFLESTDIAYAVLYGGALWR